MILGFNCFGTHETLEILEHCFENNIILCRLPSHTSHKLQPCDVAVFAPLKAAYRDQVERLERGGVNTIGKEHFTSLYSPAREQAFTAKNIKAGWAASGLFPFNPDRVLRNTPRPPAERTVLEDDGARTEHCLQEEAQHTPITPVSPTALVSLLNRIQHEAHALDETSVQRRQRHVQKLANAAQISFAERTLQQDQIRFMATINNEAQVRRSTKSVVLGKAKVMSYEDLEEARAKRAAKEEAKTTREKGKRGRKRKGAVREADAPQPKVARMNETQVADNGIAPELLRVPVARMR